MRFDGILGFSVGDWFSDATYEFSRYFHSMSTTQWAILSACAVAFGFLCLKGTKVNR